MSALAVCGRGTGMPSLSGLDYASVVVWRLASGNRHSIRFCSGENSKCLRDHLAALSLSMTSPIHLGKL